MTQSEVPGTQGDTCICSHTNHPTILTCGLEVTPAHTAGHPRPLQHCAPSRAKASSGPAHIRAAAAAAAALHTCARTCVCVPVCVWCLCVMLLFLACISNGVLMPVWRHTSKKLHADTASMSVTAT
eukprot:1144154-Pelagomonas_calceolata.AAC.1